MRIRLLPILLLLLPSLSQGLAQQTAPSWDRAADAVGSRLLYVVYLSRHGVRSPTGSAAQYNRYSAGQWPQWPVQPGYLTPHGFQLMQLFGAYDRMELANEGLLREGGCANAGDLTFYADSDQRTLETAKALVQGMMPGCDVAVGSLPEGTNDPLFHPTRHDFAKTSSARARAAVAGRIGGDPAHVTAAYHDTIATLDHMLATCGGTPASEAARTSLLLIPATLSEGNGDHLVEMKGPINTASTLVENLLLEYTEGMADKQVGWGCVHHDDIEALMSLHTTATDLTQRTPAIANSQAANLLDLIRLSIEQAASHTARPGAMGKPTDRGLFLIGHDTNIENVAGALGLSWIVDGRFDDTPPGGAFVLELWSGGKEGEDVVRAYYTAQTLDQMRMSLPLTLDHPPVRVPVFIPGCSLADMACPLPSFLKLLER